MNRRGQLAVKGFKARVRHPSTLRYRKRRRPEQHNCVLAEARHDRVLIGGLNSSCRVEWVVGRFHWLGGTGTKVKRVCCRRRPIGRGQVSRRSWRQTVHPATAFDCAPFVRTCRHGSRQQGARGPVVLLTAATIRGVALGVVGVALIQSLLLGIGYFAIGLQATGLLTLAALLLGIVQVPLILLTLPVVVYVFATEATPSAILFLIWNVVVGLSDNTLRPLMLGRGLEVPMPVILMGVMGGMIVDGLLGLFVGPVLLAVSYVLLLEWLRQHPASGGPQIDGSAARPSSESSGLPIE